jgi:5-methylcytosine-specific restriction endonuclease McrA
MYGDDLARRSKLEILSEQQGHRCCYCGTRFTEEPPSDIRLYHDPRPSIEHVIRIADGGAKSWDNEVAACRGCNRCRGEMDPHIFFDLVRQGDMEALRQALRTSVSAKRRSRETLRAQGPGYRLVQQKGKWPPAIGELEMTPARQRYFDEVYGVWQQPSHPAKIKVFPSAKKDDRFITVAGIKALRWNIKSA